MATITIATNPPSPWAGQNYDLVITTDYPPVSWTAVQYNNSGSGFVNVGSAGTYGTIGTNQCVVYGQLSFNLGSHTLAVQDPNASISNSTTFTVVKATKAAYTLYDDVGRTVTLNTEPGRNVRTSGPVLSA